MPVAQCTSRLQPWRATPTPTGLRAKERSALGWLGALELRKRRPQPSSGLLNPASVRSGESQGEVSGLVSVSGSVGVMGMTAHAAERSPMVSFLRSPRVSLSRPRALQYSGWCSPSRTAATVPRIGGVVVGGGDVADDVELANDAQQDGEFAGVLRRIHGRLSFSWRWPIGHGSGQPGMGLRRHAGRAVQAVG